MQRPKMDIESMEQEILDGRTKGLPGGVLPLRLGEIGKQGWNVLNEDLPLPLVVVRRSHLEHNIELMAGYCRRNDVELAPHGKTTMAPQIFAKQLEAGAWGITAASVEQLHVYRYYGVSKVIYANQLGGRPHLEYVCREIADDPGFEICSFVDSVASVQSLADAADRHGLSRPFKVLLEVGYPGGRTGTRRLEQVEEIRQIIAKHPKRVELIGVTGFEGLLPVGRRLTEEPAGESGVTIESHLHDVAHAVDHLLERDSLPESFIVTAGGSAAFDKVIEFFASRWKGRARVILRSGCYVTHDHLMYMDSPLQNPNPGAEEGSGPWLRPALELWSYVHSTPEPGLALLTFGRRDVGSDYGFPVPHTRILAGSRSLQPVENWRIERLNDQHAYLRYPAEEELDVGDRLQCGISHPCTTFDKWKVIPVVNDAHDVVGAIRTFF
jgi:D-serine dehydratase